MKPQPIIKNRSSALAQLFLLVAAGLATAATASPLTTGPGYDREVYRYIGMLIRNGGIPYLNVFDHKPPLIYLVCAFVHPLGPYGLWGAETILSLLSGIALFIHARREQWPFPVFYPVFFYALYWVPALNGGGQTRGFTALIVLLWLCLPHRSSGGLECVKGFLLGTVCLFQQEEILGLLPFMALLLYETPREKIVRRLFAWIAGVSAIVIPVLTWLAARHGLRPFWEQALGFNLEIYPQMLAPRQRIPFALWCVARSHFRWPFVWLMALTGFALAQKEARSTKWLVAALISCLLQFPASVALSAHLYGHYWLGMLPYFILATGMAMAINARHASKAVLAGLLGLAWMISPALSPTEILRGIPNAFARRHAPAYRERWGPLYSLLEPSRGQRGQLLVFRFIPPLSLNTDLNIMAPTPYVYTHFWDSPAWDPDGSRFTSILTNLDLCQTEWILDYSPFFPIRQPLQKRWDSYISSHYTASMHAGEEAILFHRRKIL